MPRGGGAVRGGGLPRHLRPGLTPSPHADANIRFGCEYRRASRALLPPSPHFLGRRATRRVFSRSPRSAPLRCSGAGLWDSEILRFRVLAVGLPRRGVASSACAAVHARPGPARPVKGGPTGLCDGIFAAFRLGPWASLAGRPRAPAARVRSDSARPRGGEERIGGCVKNYIN